jgi:hypothetical protein
VGGLEFASCHLVKHRRKESEVISADEGDLDIGALSRGPFEVSRGLYDSESATQNNDLCFSSIPVDFVHHVSSTSGLETFIVAIQANQRIFGLCSLRKILKSSTKML